MANASLPGAALFLYIAPVSTPTLANTFLFLAASHDASDEPKPYFEWLQNYAHIIPDFDTIERE